VAGAAPWGFEEGFGPVSRFSRHPEGSTSALTGRETEIELLKRLLGQTHQAIDLLEEVRGELLRLHARHAAEPGGLGQLASDASGHGGGAGLGSLTPRQREVAALVAAGKKNHEIAELLFLSRSTVERHLARIFARLGLSSRTTLAALVERERSARGEESS
jgi:DNA-binding NarL/FixJ family response regulator